MNSFTALNVYFPLEGKIFIDWEEKLFVFVFVFQRLDSVMSREIATEFVQFIANHMQDSRIVNIGKESTRLESNGIIDSFCFRCSWQYDSIVECVLFLFGFIESFGKYERIQSNSINSSTSNTISESIVGNDKSYLSSILERSRIWFSLFECLSIEVSSKFKKRSCSRSFGKLFDARMSIVRSILDPAPSLVYQKEIGRYLLKNVDEAITFLNSLLGQLNWAFSEFMGLLKDVRFVNFSKFLFIRSLFSFSFSWFRTNLGWYRTSNIDKWKFVQLVSMWPSVCYGQSKWRLPLLQQWC